MRKISYCFIITLLTIVLFNPNQTLAVYNPLSVPNNKIGIHILFTEEVLLAKDFSNTNGGDWGYVTIPIQAGDKDIKKWQKFMDDCKKFHLIPILRIATEGDYFKKSTWRKPEDADIIDFANFLDSLDWPVKNRYVIVFNEVNRGDEYEGKADPENYAKLLSYAVTVFKSKSDDFFIISSGMDNAAETDGINYNQYDYFRLMNVSVPGIFNQIDGFSSHSYPNPAFSQAPYVNTPRSIYSFQYETDLIEQLSVKKIPVFITETGWDQETVTEKTAINYFNEALNGVWSDSNIVAITPFLLLAGDGPFQKFSFVKGNGEKKEIFTMFEKLTKIKGTPNLYPEQKVLGTKEKDAKIPVKDFSNFNHNKKESNLKKIIKWLFLRK